MDKNKWKYDTKEWEDFADFICGVSFVMVIVAVSSGLALVVLKGLGIVAW